MNSTFWNWQATRLHRKIGHLENGTSIDSETDQRFDSP
jgi:hypothetical protein